MHVFGLVGGVAPHGEAFDATLKLAVLYGQARASNKLNLTFGAHLQRMSGLASETGGAVGT